MAQEQSTSSRDIVVIGGSSGALQALGFISNLPSDFPAALFVVVHLAPGGPGLLPDIIGRYSKIPVEHARDGASVVPSRIYVAPPDYHMSLTGQAIAVSRGPKENRHRPAIDVLFRSAAIAYGRRVIGVVLSGMLDDGSAGLLAIRDRGGLGIVQDPNDALYPDMPRNALTTAGADHCVPVSHLASVLVKAASERIAEPRPILKAMRASEASMNADHDVDRNNNPDIPTDFSCPDCGGVLRQIENGSMLRFRCRVGHTYSAETLLAAQSDTVEQALWNAARMLEEKAEMARKLKDYATARNFKSAPEKFEQQARKLEADAKVIRELIKSTQGSESL